MVLRRKKNFSKRLFDELESLLKDSGKFDIKRNFNTFRVFVQEETKKVNYHVDSKGTYQTTEMGKDKEKDILKLRVDYNSGDQKLEIDLFQNNKVLYGYAENVALKWEKGFGKDSAIITEHYEDE